MTNRSSSDFHHLLVIPRSEATRNLLFADTAENPDPSHCSEGQTRSSRDIPFAFC